MLVDFLKKFVGKFGGVKFEPSDQQIIDHLEAKVNRFGDLKPNSLMDEFITTIEGDKGICYTHPDRLPGTYIYIYTPQALATKFCQYEYLILDLLIFL